MGAAGPHTQRALFSLQANVRPLLQLFLLSLLSRHLHLVDKLLLPELAFYNQPSYQVRV